MVTELWCVQDFFYNNQRGIAQKLRKGQLSFLYATHCLHLILIPIKLHEDISTVTDLWGVQRYFGKPKRHNLEAKTGETTTLSYDTLSLHNTHFYKFS